MPRTRAVTVIPASVGQIVQGAGGTKKKKRVAAYARVSTDNDEQLSSYEARVDYYSKNIKGNPEWDYVDIYSDEGISATSTKKRAGFNRMIRDALAGKVDLIVTKSVSRFARNTVDTLSTVRQLKEKGVEVFFEKENIYTMDSKGELLITIMSSLAQEESRSISENVTWGQRKRFADGKVSMPYKRFLGYEQGENGQPKIVEKEAAVIRLIYKLFLEGKNPYSIAKDLTVRKILTPGGKHNWSSSTVKSILMNEKYKGDALLQKTYTVDFLTKKQKTNEGEIPKYYVENSHPGIISSEVFDMVQYELEKRKKVKGYKTSGSCFSGKIVCGECGSFYGRKVWHSNSKHRQVIWQCNHKYGNRDRCRTPHIYEETIKKAFIKVFNCILNNKDELIQDYKNMILELMDTTKQDKRSEELEREAKIVAEMIQKCVQGNTNDTLDQQDYIERYQGLVQRYGDLKKTVEEIDNERLKMSVKREGIKEFMQNLNKQGEFVTDFDEDLWLNTIEKVAIYTEKDIVLYFKDGGELTWQGEKIM